MTIQIQELQSLLTQIEQDSNDDGPTIKSIQERFESLQIKSNGVMQDFAECCFEQQDEISRQKHKINQLTKQMEKESNSYQLENGTGICENIKHSLQAIFNDYDEIMNDEFVQSGQLANLYEQISIFMLDAGHKVSIIPSQINHETNQVGAQVGDDKSEVRRKSVIPETSLQELKQALQDKGEDTENKLVDLVQKICDEMENKHGQQIDELQKTNDDTFNKMKAMMIELNMYKYTNQNSSSNKVRSNYKRFALILFSSWIILGGIFAKYHFHVIEQLKARYESEIGHTVKQSVGYSMFIPLTIGMLVTMVLTKFGVDIFGTVWNVCKLCWSGIKWIFHMILPEHIYVTVFEFGEKKRWKRRGSTGRLASYEEDTVRVKKVRVRGK